MTHKIYCDPKRGIHQFAKYSEKCVCGMKCRKLPSFKQSLRQAARATNAKDTS